MKSPIDIDNHHEQFVRDNEPKPENEQQAFPTSIAVDEYGTAYHGHPGMTLRQWYAGQALSGMASLDEDEWVTPEHLAEQSYLIADAMIKAGKL